jgi:hypothetical protein
LYARKRRQKVDDKAKAKAADYAKRGAAAVEYARKILEEWVRRGVFEPDYEKDAEEAVTSHLHERMPDFLWYLAHPFPNRAPGNTYYLACVAAVSANGAAAENERTRKMIESLPKDELRYPTDVKNYILNHLLRNFEDTKSLRGYHLKGHGKKIPKRTRDDAIATTVVMTAWRFGLHETRSADKKPCGCSCVHMALGQLGIHYLKDIKSVYERSKEATLLREWYEQSGKPLVLKHKGETIVINPDGDEPDANIGREFELILGRRVWETREEAFDRHMAEDVPQTVDADGLPIDGSEDR